MKTINKILMILLCAFWIGLPLRQPVCFAVSKTDVKSVIDSILTYKCGSVGAADVDALIDGDLTANAGVTADWYIFGLKQYGYTHDYSGFAASLKRFAETNEVESAVTDERVALLFAALDTEPDYITQVTDTAIGQLGVMSYVYGLHLLNNGYRSSVTDARTVVAKLLEMQMADGGWAVMGTVGDVDVTAMTLASLAPYYATDSAVKQAADRAFSLLSERQKDDGGYQSFGQESPESAAQVIVALTSYGIDPLTDARFIKNGNTAYDAMLSFRLADGSFEHTAGKGSNHTATVQAFYSSVALYRYLNGQPGLYVLQRGSTVPATEPPITQKPTEAPPQTTAKRTETAKPTTTVPAQKPTEAPKQPTTKKQETTAAPTTKKAETTAAPTTKKAETTAGSGTTAAVTGNETTSTVILTTADGSSESATAASTTLPPDLVVNVIRPERTTAAPDTEEPGTTGEEEPQTDSGKQNGGHAAWYVAGIALAGAAAAAVVLIKKKKTDL